MVQNMQQLNYRLTVKAVAINVNTIQCRHTLIDLKYDHAILIKSSFQLF